MQDIRKSPEYQQWRREVRQRDENTCRICGVQRNLHVHHIKPLEKYPGFATEFENGITLCGNCHAFLNGREESTNLQTLIEAVTGQQDTRTVEQLKRLNDKFGDYLDTLLKSSDCNTRSNAVYKLFVHLQIYPDSLDQFIYLIEHILYVKSGFGEGLAKQIVVEFLENHSSKVAAQVISKYENSCYQEGKDAYSKDDYATALKKLKPLSERGHVGSQHLLGVMYGNGTGVNKNYEQAIKWFRKAAEQGYDRAQCNLGIIYKRGMGVDEDDAEAVKWFRRAAEQGYDKAQYYLGVMYGTGKGVDKDDAEAIKWYRKAAEQGYDRAQYLLGQMYRVGEGVDQDNMQAVKWFRKAAEQGYDRAQWFLGVMYRAGKGVDQNDAEVVKWFRKAAEQGHELAQNQLEQMYENDKDVPEIDEADLQGIAITRKDFFQRLSVKGIELCLSTLKTNDARIEIKNNQFTLSDIGSPSGCGLSAPLSVLFDEKVDHGIKIHPSGISDQLRGEIFLTKEDIPILKVFFVGIKIRAHVKEKLDEAERNISEVYGGLWTDVEAFQIDVIRLWRDEIDLQSVGFDEEIIGSLTDLRHQIHGSIDRILEALHRRRTIIEDVVALTEENNT